MLKKGDTVYVSGPYTTGNVNANVQRAIQEGEKLKALGLVPFIPHLYHLWDLASPHDYEYWMDLCLAWVPQCRALYLIPGESSGARREVKLASESGVQVFTSLEQVKLELSLNELAEVAAG